MKREDDFVKRRQHLAQLSDEQLKQRFWQLAQQLTDPLLALGRTHTSPSVERSVLLRMGFSSLEAKAIVDGCVQHGLLRHGAGHVVYKLHRQTGLALRDAGLALAQGQKWDAAQALFDKEAEDVQ